MSSLVTNAVVALCVCPIVAAPVIVANSPKARTVVAKKMHKAANRLAPKAPERTHTELPPCAPTMYEPPLALPPATPPIQFAPMSITAPPAFVQLPGDYVPPYDEGGWGGATVPEPDTWALMVIGFGAVGILSRHRNKELSA